MADLFCFWSILLVKINVNIQALRISSLIQSLKSIHLSGLRLLLRFLQRISHFYWEILILLFDKMIVHKSSSWLFAPYKNRFVMWLSAICSNRIIIYCVRRIRLLLLISTSLVFSFKIFHLIHLLCSLLLAFVIAWQLFSSSSIKRSLQSFDY